MKKNSESVKRIKTNIKFMLDSNNTPIGFMTKERGSWRGCYKDDPRPHKIVVPDKSIIASIVPDYICRCTLIPMKSGSGFVCINAEVVMRHGYVEVTPEHQVIAHFGNRTIVYNPKNGRSRGERSRNTALQLLSERKDISNIEEVISDFIDACETIDKFFGLG